MGIRSSCAPARLKDIVLAKTSRGCLDSVPRHNQPHGDTSLVRPHPHPRPPVGMTMPWTAPSPQQQSAAPVQYAPPVPHVTTRSTPRVARAEHPLHLEQQREARIARVARLVDKVRCGCARNTIQYNSTPFLPRQDVAWARARLDNLATLLPDTPVDHLEPHLLSTLLLNTTVRYQTTLTWFEVRIIPLSRTLPTASSSSVPPSPPPTSPAPLPPTPPRSCSWATPPPSRPNSPP